jgi:sigma-B regulation protein RsbU (phosphoserine phosphatase)
MSMTSSFARSSTWQERLDQVILTMREMSSHTDPQEMVRAYGKRIREMIPINSSISLSRRNLAPPHYRITRASKWNTNINPWKEPEKLPIMQGGLLGELLYAGQPRIIDDLHISPDDPAAEFFTGSRSLVAIPHFDMGEAPNMVVMLREQPYGFDREELPEQVWISNLFGRAAYNLRLREEVQQAYDTIDRELKAVARIQRSLLPRVLPKIPGWDLAAYYQTSMRAGGDYYDFFRLPENQWGVLIADVSGHGTPAAVLMAVTHTIAHSYPGPAYPPSRLLEYVNERLAEGYTNDIGAFVTAFYGIYDPPSRRLTYVNAGHPPPRLKRCADGTLHTIEGEPSMPLGLFSGTRYPERSIQLIPGDQIIFYTDGITEAQDPQGHLYGTNRLDQVLSNCGITAQGLLDEVLQEVAHFSAGQPAQDDRTMVVAKVLEHV